MGRTNYSLNEMLNAVTKRAFNRYTPQTVDYQHLEAATTKTGLVSNRREYSSASILADTFSLNATNIAESNYDPFLKTFVSDSIDRKTFQIGGGYAFTFTDDRRFMAVTTLFNNTDLNEVRVYEFDETLVEQFELATTGTIDTSSYAQTFDVDINHDGSQIFVLKRFGTSAEHHYGVDVFDETLAIISSTTFITMPLDPFNEPSASLSVTEDGNRVCMSLYVSDLFIRVHDNLNISAYYSILINDVSTTFFSLMSKNGRTLVVSNSGTILTFEIPTTSPSGIVTLNPVQTQVMGIHHFDLSHDGKVMLTHSGSGVQIYTWNGLQWKQVGQNITTGLTQVYSSAISYYVDYFVVASDSQMKVFKWNRNSKIFEQYGDTMRGDFGTVEQKIQINKSGDTVVIGNSQKNSSTGRSYTYVHEGERWGLINETNGSATGDALGKFLRVSNNGDKIILGMTGEISMKTTNLINKSSGWKQRGNTLIATTVNDGFGTSLSLSNDGNYLAIGIPNSYSFVGTGSVKTYKFSSGKWSQFTQNIFGEGPENFGKYVTISSNGSKVAVGNDKNSIIKVFETGTKTIPSSSVVDTISTIPQNSILEMNGDGNRLFLKTGQFTVWDKNTDDAWVYTNAFSDGDAVHLSNNGTYVSVDHNTTARMYEIDSSGVVSKIGSDITPFTLYNSLNIIRSFNPTHININTSNSGHLNLASYLDSTQQVEICSLDWDPNIFIEGDFTTQSSEITGFNAPTTTKYGLLMNKGGDILIVHDDTKFSIYTYNGLGWSFSRSTTNLTLHYFAVSYDGSVIAYSIGSAIIIETTASGTSLGQIGVINSTSLAFRDSSTLAVCVPNQDILLYRYLNGVWLLEDLIEPGYSNPFVKSHTQWSGDGSILAIGDAIEGRATFYSHSPIPTFNQIGSTFSGPTQQVVSGNGNVIVTGGDVVQIYEKDGNGEWPSTPNATYSGSSIGISDDGTRVVIGADIKMFIVHNSGGTWSQLGSDILGSTTKVAISGDGTKVFNSHGTSLYSYELSSGEWIEYRSTVVTGENVEKVDASSDGELIALSIPDGNEVYRDLVGLTSIKEEYGEQVYEKSGWSVALSSDGTRLVVGHPYYDMSDDAPTPTLYSDVGRVRVYDWNGSDWVQIGQDMTGPLTNSSSHGPQFGRSVTITPDGSRIVIGAPFRGYTGAESGLIRVYEWNDTTSEWDQIGQDIIAETDFQLGHSVDISPDGSRIVGGGGSLYGGGVITYKWDVSNSQWTFDQYLLSSRYSSVSMSSDGSHLIVGIIGVGGSSIGVRVYEWNTTTFQWSQIGQAIDGGSNNLGIGQFVDISSDGSRIIVGAFGVPTRVYEWDATNSQWTQLGQDISGVNSYEKFGWSVAMSSDGSRIVIGGLYNKIYLDVARARIYDWSGTEWVQNGDDIFVSQTVFGEDDAGYAVTMSSDGSTIAVGFPYDTLVDGTSVSYWIGKFQVYLISDSPSYTLNSTFDGPMIDMSNDGTTVVSSNDGFTLFALSGDGTKVVSWFSTLSQIRLYFKHSSGWLKTHEIDVIYTPTSLSINNDGSIIGVATVNDVRFYDVEVTQSPNGWTLHSFIEGGGSALEKFGSVIDISSDGTTVIVGAPGDGTSSYRGYAKMYDYESSIWTIRSTISPPDDTESQTHTNFGKSVSLSSNGNRVGYVFDQETQTGIEIVAESIVISSNYLTQISVNGGSWKNTNGFALNSYYPYIRLTSASYTGTNSGIWFPVTFGSVWSITFEWNLDNNDHSGDGDDMRVVFYAPNQPSSYEASQHSGYYVFHEFYQTEVLQIRTPSDSDLFSRTVSYGSSTSFKTVTVSYDNGVLFTRVTGTNTTGLNQGYSYTFTGSDLSAQQALWGTQTYVAITGRTGGVAASQYIRNINISWDSEVPIKSMSSQASIRDDVNGVWTNPLGSDEVVNLSEERELAALSMSYDGYRYGIRAISGSYDAIVKGFDIDDGAWTRRGDIINFTAPTSIASNSLRALSSSSDGNVIAFGMNTMVKVYGFSDDTWSQLGSDILPSVSNPGEISMDISSDGMVIAILISRTTSDPAVCKVFVYSSGSWSQSGSSIDFRVGGTNKVKLSGDGTTVALGNVGDLSNVIRVYKKGQDWELISPTLFNSFEGGLNLTDDGTKLVTLNTSSVEFSTFSTQLVTYTPQYLNDITIPGTTEDMGDIRLSDSGDRLFVMAGDEKVHVYDNLHNEEFVTGAQLSVRNFSVNGDGSYIVLTNDVGNVAVFGRTNTSWSPIGSEIVTNMTGGVSTDINGDGTSIVLVSPNDDLRLYTYEGGTWSQANSSTGTRGTSVFISDTADIIVGNIESIKTFEIKDVIQDISFSAPTLSLDGDEYIRLNAGSVYTENGATITTTATTTPTVKISGSVVTREPGIYTIQYEAEDIQRKTAEPIFRKVEVIPSVSIIKLEGPGVIYHTQGTALKDPGVTASVPVSVYYTAPDSTLVISGFPNFLTATTLGEYKIYYTNDIPDKYLRSSLLVKRSVFVRARPILSLAGASTVFNPLNQTYNDLGVTFTQPEVSSPIVSVTFNTPRVGVTETQTVTYNAKDQFGIEAIPITRQVIVKKRPTITTSGTLYRILNDPISIPAPTVTPSTLSGVVQTSNNININQIGDYSITYDVTDTDGISSVTTRQRYEVGSYGKHTLSKNGTLSTFSRDGRSLAIFSTNVQIYKLDADGSWVSNGFITIPSGSPVTSMNFSFHGRHIIIGMSSHFTIGLVRVYKENTLFTGGWEQVGLDIFGVDYLGKFGHAVEINELGTRIFVSAPEANTNSGTLFRGGLVKIFKWDGTFWFEEKTFEGFSPAELFGTSITISTDGKVLAVGSPGYTRSTIAEDDTVTTVNVGKTSIYKFIDNVWEDYVGTDIEDGTEGARNGFSLSMSGNGKILAVGSESGGGVRVYSIGALRWSPLGSHISGSFGKSVSLSDDNTLVIGSENENYGRVYIYNLESDWSKSSPIFDKVIVAESDVNDMGKRVHVNASGTFTCVDSETEVRVYEI